MISFQAELELKYKIKQDLFIYTSIAYSVMGEEKFHINEDLIAINSGNLFGFVEHDVDIDLNHFLYKIGFQYILAL